MEFYRPFPRELTVKRSDYLSNITGCDELGLFALKNIAKNVRWMTHVRTNDPNFEDGLIRLPMGGFFNHNSTNPNCEIIHEGIYIFLQTIREIEEGEELTAKYTLYNPEIK